MGHKYVWDAGRNGYADTSTDHGWNWSSWGNDGELANLNNQDLLHQAKLGSVEVDMNFANRLGLKDVAAAQKEVAGFDDSAYTKNQLNTANANAEQAKADAASMGNWLNVGQLALGTWGAYEAYKNNKYVRKDADRNYQLKKDVYDDAKTWRHNTGSAWANAQVT